MTHPYVGQYDSNYENYIAFCPICSFKNIYNRATDLETFEVIDFRTVKCFNCNGSFNINYDLINPVYEYLIFDCDELKAQKRYMYCILNLSQAVEVFLAYCIEVKLLLQPSKDKVIQTARSFDDLSVRLENVLKYCTFEPLKNIFTNLFLEDMFLTETSVIDFVIKLEKRKDNPKKKRLEDKEIKTCSESNLANLLIKLNNLKVNTIRNEIVHKYARRPTLIEVEACQNEVKEVVYGLAEDLGIENEAYYLIG